MKHIKRWVVMLHHLDNDGTSATFPENRRMNWAGLHTMNRAAEQVAKVCPSLTGSHPF